MTGPVTGRRSAASWSQFQQSSDYGRKRRTPRCPGPLVDWCPVDGCEVVHPSRELRDRAVMFRDLLFRMGVLRYG